MISVLKAKTFGKMKTSFNSTASTTSITHQKGRILLLILLTFHIRRLTNDGGEKELLARLYIFVAVLDCRYRFRSNMGVADCLLGLNSKQVMHILEIP